MSIDFTKARYAPHATAHINITLKNTGSVALHRIGAACDRMGDPDELRNTGSSWGPLAVSASGVTLAPHTARTVHVTASVPAAAQREGQVVAACDFGYHNVDSGYRPRANDTARVPGQSGALQGTVVHYVHGNSGATTGLSGVRAVLVDPTTCPIRKRAATTGPKGRFTIKAPAGTWYRLYLLLPHGWTIGGNPTNAMVLGRDTTHFFFQVKRGTTHNPKLPTSCS